MISYSRPVTAPDAGASHLTTRIPTLDDRITALIFFEQRELKVVTFSPYRYLLLRRRLSINRYISSGNLAESPPSEG
ncbi:MAG: hypothetical protein F6K58_30435 [Symploca sp. SIO2E9]|nr:hypothetical protein [Symploca sp. SIO2E9]